MAFDAGDLFIDVTPDMSGFLTKLTAGVNGILPGVSQLGGKVGLGLSVGLLAAGGLATKMALDFEEAFTRIDAVSNASQEDISRWRDEVLSLAGETANAPRELADALYFLASAGLDSAQVSATLEQSAKASAVGLGETADIARVTAQALNAYADSGLTATQVTDTLVAAVREGTAEPQEFANALGRILPIASRAGIEFDEVTASLSALSNIGLDVNEGVTAMRGLLQALVAPGTQAGQALAAAGISAEEMRRVLADDGLLAGLQLLEKRTQGNLDQLRLIVPNIRALTGELGLMGGNAAQVAKIFDNVRNSTGALDEAFQTTVEGPMFQFRQALAEGQVLLIRFGQALIPVASLLLGLATDVLGPLAGLLADNVGAVQLLIGAFLGFQALRFLPILLTGITTALRGMAAAALISIADGLIAIAGGLTAIGATNTAGALRGVAAILPALASAAVPVVAGLTGIVIWSNILKNSSNALREEVDRLVGSLSAPAASLALLQEELGLTRSQFRAWLLDVRTGDADLTASSLAAEKYGQAMGGALERILDVQTEVTGGTARINTLTGEVSITASNAASAYDLFGQSLLHSIDLTNEQKLTLASQLATLTQLGGQLSDTTRFWLNNAVAAGEFDKVSEFLKDRIRAVNTQLRDTGRASGEAADGFAKVFDKGSQLADTLGLSFAELQASVQAAVLKDGGTFGKAFDELVGKIEGKVFALRQSFAESLGQFTGDALGELLEKNNLTVDGIVEGFEKATRATEQFGRNVGIIAETGGRDGRLLAQQLVELGPAAADFADFVAGASDKARRKIVEAFGDGERAADSMANNLTRKVVGVLGDIRTLLEALAQKWDIDVVYDDNGAQAKAKNLLDTISRLPASKVIRIKLEQSGRDIGQFAAGTDNFPGVGIVGEQGPELLVAPRGSRIIPNSALRAAGAGAGGLQVVSGRLTIDERGVAWIDGRARQVSREEDDAEAGFRAGLGRLR